MNVITLPAVPMEGLRPRPDCRDGPFGKQWHAGQVLESMIRKGIPNDAYGVMAVTMGDLYPKPEWNFVYGLARLRDRVGVFSFVRHTPTGGQTAWRGHVAWREAQMLHRSLKTLLHEIGHMFGLKHCTWYNCLMRGSNGEGVENQLNYLHLCPVCLRKLHWNIGFDIPACYAGLLDIFQKYSTNNEYFARDCEFLQGRLQAMQDLEPAVTLTSEKSKASNANGPGTDRVARRTSQRDLSAVARPSKSGVPPARSRSVASKSVVGIMKRNLKPVNSTCGCCATEDGEDIVCPVCE
jgi:predicted Zn-dependent protease